MAKDVLQFLDSVYSVSLQKNTHYKENKRQTIIKAGYRIFATRPFDTMIFATP